MPSSYNGWPASPDKDEIGVVSNGVFPGGVKAGDVSTVLGYVMRQLDARVEPVVDGWCWGYTYKANVNNPSQLSCHASGTAGDFNAPDHPNGSSGTFTDQQVGTIYQILAEVSGAVSWLQGYDEMHFEICVDAATLAQVAAGLGDAPAPTPGPDPEPEPVEDDDMPRRIVQIYDGPTVIAEALDGPTGVVIFKSPNERDQVRAVIDNDTQVTQGQVNTYNAVLARGPA